MQIGIMMIKNTEMQTASDAASLAGVSSIQAVPLTEEANIVENNGQIESVNIQVSQWEIQADQDKADEEAIKTYQFNTDLNEADYTGEMKTIDDVNHIYSYQSEIKDTNPPLIILKSLFKDHEGVYFHIKSTSKARVVIP